MAQQDKIPKSFVTTQEAAELLGVSLRTVQLWAENGLLQGWKTEGGHRRIQRASVERLLAGRLNAAEVDRAAAGVAAPADPLRVMIVEDDPSLLRLYRVRLARWPMHPKVATAANGFEGLVRIGSERPDLLIADLSLPEMDGFQMLRTIRAMPELDATEIVVVSGLDAAAIAAKGGLPDGIPTLTKPIPFGELERIALRVATQTGRFIPAGT